MTPIPKLIGFSLAISSFTIMLIMSTFAAHLQLAYAGGKSPYESGYDHGCDDADISDPDERYINQPEKGPSFHTDQFMAGYREGVGNCSDGDNGSGTSQDEGPDDSEDGSVGSETGNRDWRGICSTLQIALYSSCEELVDNDDGSLTSEGERALGV